MLHNRISFHVSKCIEKLHKLQRNLSQYNILGGLLAPNPSCDCSQESNLLLNCIFCRERELCCSRAKEEQVTAPEPKRALHSTRSKESTSFRSYQK